MLCPNPIISDAIPRERDFYCGKQLYHIGLGSFLFQVDEYSRTNIPSIWAVGDVTNRANLTPVALMEGTCFAVCIFFLPFP